jgi:hypothetical protein
VSSVGANPSGFPQGRLLPHSQTSGYVVTLAKAKLSSLITGGVSNGEKSIIPFLPGGKREPPDAPRDQPVERWRGRPAEDGANASLRLRSVRQSYHRVGRERRCRFLSRRVTSAGDADGQVGRRAEPAVHQVQLLRELLTQRSGRWRRSALS